MLQLPLLAQTARQETNGSPKPLKQQQSGNPGPEQKAQSDQVIKVTMRTSRKEVTGERSCGLYADLENVATEPVTIYPLDTVLVIQPEVTQTSACVYANYAMFPTEPSPDSKDPKSAPIHIRPKEHYMVFWDVNKANTNTCAVTGSWWDSMTFVPGDYSFTVEGKAYLSPGFKEESNYHTFSESIALRVSVPQTVAIIAAMVGGILAYFVASLRPGGDFDQFLKSGHTWIFSTLIIFRNLVSAMLLSAVVTIVASRVSETQFPVKVSVADFWGALTIGFVAYFIGNRVIDQLVKVGTGSRVGSAPAVRNATGPDGSKDLSEKRADIKAVE